MFLKFNINSKKSFIFVVLDWMHFYLFRIKSKCAKSVSMLYKTSVPVWVYALIRI